MMPQAARRRERSRSAFRRKAVAACVGAFLLAAVCLLGSLRVIEYFRAKSREKFIRGRSGGRYTPAEAAKRAVDKIRGER